ncbi:MAG: SPW repeat protein [Thermodesulfobacteriota bacterium]|jgi:hypothetical protein
MKHTYLYLLSLVLGLWLLISPYVLGFTEVPVAYWNAVGVGLGTVVVAAVGLAYGWGETADHSLPAHLRKA